MAEHDHRRPAILQVLPRLEPEVLGRQAVDLARYLRSSGWRAFVASSGGRLERELAAAGATHLKLPLERAGWLADWGNAGRLARAVRRYRIALVQAPMAGSAWSAVLAARRAGVPFVVTCHESCPEHGPALRRFERVVSAGRQVVAVSDYLADELARRGAAAPARIRVVRPWIDPELFDPDRVRGYRMAGLADRWGIAPDTRLVLVPGPLAPESGHRALLEAMAGLDRRDFTLLLLGHAEPDGAYARELTALLRTWRLGDRVRFGGDVDDLPAALALADVVVLPVSRPEPSGLLAAAAQAMGKPVIVTDQGALAESVMPSATGWLVPPDDAGELGRALDLALSLDEEVRQRLAARARAYVVGTFGMQAMCERMLEIYRELLRMTPHRHPAVAGPVAEVS